MWNLGKHRASGGFLLLVVMGLLTLLLVLCVGFLVAVRSQTHAVMRQRERTDILNLAYSGLDFACAEISGQIFSSANKVDSSQYVTSASNKLNWYKDLADKSTQPSAVSGVLKWDGTGGYPTFSSSRETKWVYLPADYFVEGALRARIAVQILDNNAFLSGNDWLQDANPTQAQQAHIFQAALDWNNAESSKAKINVVTDTSVSPASTITYACIYPGGNNLFRYSDAWKLASRSLRSVTSTPYYPAHSGFVGSDPKETTKATPDELYAFLVSPNVLTTNTTYFNLDGMESCAGQTQGKTTSEYMPIVSCHPFTNTDTGRSPLNVNTCFNSGELALGPQTNTKANSHRTQVDLEGVFNIGSLRRIIKVGSFYASASGNSGVVPGWRYLDPYLYPGNQYFKFDANHQVMRDADGKPVPKNPLPSNPTFPVELDSLTENTIDPATVTIDPVDSKMSYYVTPIGSGGRPYVYKSYDDLYVALDTEEKVQLEKLKTKLAVYYQETLCRYFVASYKKPGHAKYSSYDATTSASGTDYKYYYKNYNNTYALLLGATGDGVAHASEKYDYTTPRFPFSIDDFRKYVKADLIAMTKNNNNKAAWGYDASASKDGGEYVNFDSAGMPEICAGKLDKRTASAIFDNICPGKRFLFPTETNLEIKDPIGQLYKRRVGIDEEHINWIHQTPTPTAPSEPLWKPKTGTFTEVAAFKAGPQQGGVNPPRMNDPYDFYLYKEDQNENGLLDPGEDLTKYKLSNEGGLTIWALDPVTGGANSNGILDTFDSDRVYRARERGQEVWTADPSNPVKGHDYLSITGFDRFLDENVYFNTAENPINPASFDPNKPNCLIHPLPALGTPVKDSFGNMVATVQSGLLSDFNGNGKFDTIEYIPGHATLDNGGQGVDLNGDNMINTYYCTPERQLAFGPDCFSTELTTTSVSYRIVVTAELCDAASVLTNPAAPVVVGHTEINASVQLAPDVEDSAAREGASEYVKADASDFDPGLRYYRTNQPTIRKTRSYVDSTGEIVTYNVKTGLTEAYDPVKERKRLQIRGGIVDENSTRLKSQMWASGGTTYPDRKTDNTSAAREWIDPLGVPDAYRTAYYKDYQTKRRIVVRDMMNLGSKY